MTRIETLDPSSNATEEREEEEEEEEERIDVTG